VVLFYSLITIASPIPVNYTCKSFIKGPIIYYVPGGGGLYNFLRGLILGGQF